MPRRYVVLPVVLVLAILSGEVMARELDRAVVRVDLEVDGAAVTGESLNLPGQTFEGTVDGGRIRGVFTLELRKYDGRDAPPVFDPGGTVFLPEADLEATEECDFGSWPFPELGLTILRASSHLDRWRHATIFCHWVKRSIAEGESRSRASEVLAARSGDARGRAIVLMAFCRVVGTRARIVEGAVLEEGGLSARPWVEVHMGKAGWIPLDPSSDRSDWIDATHIRLGARLRSVAKVAVHEALPRPERPVPYATGKPLVYDILTEAGRLGRITFTVDATKSGYRMSLATKFEHYARSSVLETDRHARPIRFECNTDGKSGTTKETVRFRDGVATVVRIPAGRKRSEHEVKTGRDVFLFGSEAFPLWALIVTQLDFSKGEAVKVNVFHPTWKETAHATFRPGEWTETEWEGEKVRALPVAVLLGCKSMRFWLDDRNRVLRCDEGSRHTVLRR